MGGAGGIPSGETSGTSLADEAFGHGGWRATGFADGGSKGGGEGGGNGGAAGGFGG